MHKLISCFFLFAGLSVIAQPAGYKAVDNVSEFKAKFSEEEKKINAITSDFTQEKNLALLEEKITSTGKFWYKRENKVRLEYQKPFQYLMILNKDQMFVRDEQKENRINTQGNKLFQQINKIILGSINGSILDSKDFISKVFQSEKGFLLVMTPTTKTLKEFFQDIQVQVDKKDYSVTGIIMTEPGGDNTIMKFTNRVLNPTLNDSVFTP